MQQLSLFDFGDETPKQEKKKQPSKKDISPSKKAENSDASAKEEIQQQDSDPVPTVPDQITSEEPSNLPDQFESGDNIGPQNEHLADTSEDVHEQEHSEQDAAQKDKATLEQEEQKIPEQSPAQQTSASAPKLNPESPKPHSEDLLSQQEDNNTQSDTNSTEGSFTSGPQSEEVASPTTSETEPVQKVAPDDSLAGPVINKDIVFSDESIIVKFKPKVTSSMNPSKDSSTDNPSTPSEDNLPIEDAEGKEANDSQSPKRQDNADSNGLTQSEKAKKEEVDTSFPPISDQETVDQPREKEENQPEQITRPNLDEQTSAETENDDDQTEIDHIGTKDSQEPDDDNSNQRQGEPTTAITVAEPPEKGAPRDKTDEFINNEARDGKDSEEESEQKAAERQSVNKVAAEDDDVEEQTVQKEQQSPVPPAEIYEQESATTETSNKTEDDSVDFNLAREDKEEDTTPIKGQEDAKLTPASSISHKRGRKSFKEIDAEVDLIDVPSDEELFKKQYYPISVVAKWFRVNNSLLRFWENEFKILKPKKNKKGDRFFRPEDIKNLQIIYYLLRQKKLTINGAVKHLKSKKEHTEVNLQIIQSLSDFKGFLLELRATTEK